MTRKVNPLRTHHFVTALALGIFCSTYVFALPAYIPLQERAQGHSLGGANVLNDSIFSNPAGSVFSQAYSVDGSYSTADRTLSASVLDSRTSSFTGGIGYYRAQTDIAEQPRQGLHLLLGTRVQDVVALGATGKMMWAPDANGNSIRMMDADIGTLTSFGFWEAGAVWRNVGGGNEALGQTRELAVGGRVGYNKQLFFSSTSYLSWGDFTPYQYGFGVEYITTYYISLKGGYRFQPAANAPSFWTGGLSFNSPKLSVHYAVEFPQLSGQSNTHSVGATMLF